MGTPTGDVRFADRGERGPSAALLSFFGDVFSFPGTVFLQRVKNLVRARDRRVRWKTILP